MKEISELHCGRIGEHLVAADILIQGYDCFHAAQGMPYDLVADIGGRLIKVQVKTTLRARNIPQRKTPTPAYCFRIRHGKGAWHNYAPGEVDLFAMVCIEDRLIGYIAPSNLPGTFYIRTEQHRGKHRVQDAGFYMKDMTLAKAMNLPATALEA